MSQKKFDVIVIGELNVDLILGGADREMEIGKEIMANEMALTLGSSSAIFASNLSSWGSKVSFIGKVGNDSYASLVTDSLKSKAVDISNIILDDSDQTGITVCITYGEDRANITYPGTMDLLTLNDITDDKLKQAQHMHLSSAFLQKGIRYKVVEIFKQAKRLGLTTSFDPQWDPAEKWDLNLEEMLPYVDVFLPNVTEIGLMTGTKTVEDSINKIKSFCNYVVVKDGSNGALLWDKEKIIHQKIFVNPNVADCIGAGDSFNSGFINKFVKGEDLKSCLENGALSGAINTTATGGTTAFTDYETIKDIALKKFNFEIK
jgi:sugar/nucleoside kinase (ribokinase family)